MFIGNYESSNLICVVGEQLPHTVLQNNGWQWVNEGTAVKPKWGFVTWQVGATLVLKVDTRASSQAAAEAAQGSSQQLQPNAAAKSRAATGPAAALSSKAAQHPPAGSDTASDEAMQVPDMIVWVGYVKSWRNMGTASFNCISGCRCQGTTVDALHDAGNTQQHMVKLYTTQSTECLVEVKVCMSTLMP